MARAPILYFVAVLALFSYFLLSVFSHPPFLQQEMLGQLVFWNAKPGSFLQLIFDPKITDAHPGRFRYLEYLVEAVYWKIFQKGVLPKIFYDFFSLTLVCIMALLLDQICKRRHLDYTQRFLCLMLFLLSSQVFMVAVYHFRKAKLMASFLLWILVFEGYRKSGPRPKVMTLISAIGVFTDPFYILFSPLVAFSASDFKSSLKYILRGLALGAVGVFFLNGVIGPLLNVNCRLLLWSIPQKPDAILTLTNLPYFYDIFPDLIGKTIKGVGPPELFTVIFAISYLVYLKKYFSEFLFLRVFAMALLVSTFLIRPNARISMYGGYYGIPIFCFYVLLWVDLLKASAVSRYQRWFWQGLAVCLCLLHWSHRDTVFNIWNSHHLPSSELKQKYKNDVALIQSVSQNLGQGKEVRIGLDVKGLPEPIYDSVYESLGKDRKHLLVAYVGIPILFNNEIRSGKLQIEVTP